MYSKIPMLHVKYEKTLSESITNTAMYEGNWFLASRHSQIHFSRLQIPVFKVSTLLCAKQTFQDFSIFCKCWEFVFCIQHKQLSRFLRTTDASLRSKAERHFSIVPSWDSSPYICQFVVVIFYALALIHNFVISTHPNNYAVWFLYMNQQWQWCLLLLTDHTPFLPSLSKNSRLVFLVNNWFSIGF